jgi:hypothetical protein
MDNLVDIATRLRAGKPRNRGSVPGRDKRFSLLTAFTPAWGPISLIPNGYKGLFLGGKAGGVCEAHLPPPSKCRSCSMAQN